MKITDKHGTNPMCNSDSMSSDPSKFQFAQCKNRTWKWMHKVKTSVTYSPSTDGYYNKICILCIVWFAWNII